jgi:WD40 repeat protein
MRRTRPGRWLFTVAVTLAVFLAARHWLPCVPRVEIRLPGHLRDLELSPDGSLLGVATIKSTFEDGPFRLQLWDCATAQPYAELLITDAQIESLAFSPDGRHFAALTSLGDALHATGECVVWDVANRVTTSRTTFDASHTGYREMYVAYAADGRLLLARTRPDENGRRLWDGVTGEPIETPIPDRRCEYHKGTIVGIETANEESTEFFDLVSGIRLGSTTFQAVDTSGGLDPAPAANVLAFCTWEERTLLFRDFQDRQFQKIETGAGEYSDGLSPSIKLSPDGTLCVLEASFSESSPPAVPPGVLEFLPDWLSSHLGETFARRKTNWEVRVYDVPAGRERRRLTGEAAVFSQDGKTMAVVKNWCCLNSLDDEGTRLDLYDVPFHSPFGLALAIAFAAGLPAFLLAGRLFRAQGISNWCAKIMGKQKIACT